MRAVATTVIALGMMFTAPSRAAIYVDPQQGQDGWSGTAAEHVAGRAGPLRSFPRVRSGETYLLRGGSTYHLAQDGLRIDADDVTIATYGSGTATVDGRRVTRGGWSLRVDGARVTLRNLRILAPSAGLAQGIQLGSKSSHVELSRVSVEGSGHSSVEPQSYCILIAGLGPWRLDQVTVERCNTGINVAPSPGFDPHLEIAGLNCRSLAGGDPDDSDCVTVSGPSPLEFNYNLIIHDSSFTGWRENAIDLAAAVHAVVRDNVIGAPQSQKQDTWPPTAILMGGRRIGHGQLVVGNVMRNIRSATPLPGVCIDARGGWANRVVNNDCIDSDSGFNISKAGFDTSVDAQVIVGNRLLGISRSHCIALRDSSVDNLVINNTCDVTGRAGFGIVLLPGAQAIGGGNRFGPRAARYAGGGTFRRTTEDAELGKDVLEELYRDAYPPGAD